MNRTVVLPLLLVAAPVHAQSYADPGVIDRAVTTFAGAPAVPVDRRLRLNPCVVPLALGWYGTRQDRVQVTCPAPDGWTLYVAVVGGAQVASAPLVQRGDTVTITAGGDGFAVSQPGEALENGAAGAWIKVRQIGAAGNAAMLRAQVLRPGLVGISLP